MDNSREKDFQLLEHKFSTRGNDRPILGLDIDARNGVSKFIVFLILIGNIILNGKSKWDFIRLGMLSNPNLPCSDCIIGK